MTDIGDQLLQQIRRQRFMSEMSNLPEPRYRTKQDNYVMSKEKEYNNGTINEFDYDIGNNYTPETRNYTEMNNQQNEMGFSGGFKGENKYAEDYQHKKQLDEIENKLNYIIYAIIAIVILHIIILVVNITFNLAKVKYSRQI